MIMEGNAYENLLVACIYIKGLDMMWVRARSSEMTMMNVESGMYA